MDRELKDILVQLHHIASRLREYPAISAKLRQIADQLSAIIKRLAP